MKAALLFSLLIFILFYLLGSVKVTIADDGYQVRPIILLPENWKNRITSSDMDDYKRNILPALSEVQKFYSDQLSGHYFDFDQSEVRVMGIGDLNISPQQDSLIDNDFFDEVLHGWDYFSRPRYYKEIDLLFVIGMGNHSSFALFNQNIAIINHEHLEGLRTSGSRKNAALGAIAHELGHSFGLVWSGYANSHPCSQVDSSSCIDGAPQPYPDKSETERALMGTGWKYFPQFGFNNSEHNPEKCKLFKSLFINPQGDQCPFPVISTRSTIDIESVDVINNQIKISGEGFGKKLGRVELESSDGVIKQISHIGLNWFSDEIVFPVPSDLGSNQNTRWTIRVTTEYSNESVEYKDFIIPVAEQKNNELLTASISVTCNGSVPVANLPVVFANYIGYTPNPLIRGFTNSNGYVELSYLEGNLNSNERLTFYPEGITDFQIDPQNFSFFYLSNLSDSAIQLKINLLSCDGVTSASTLDMASITRNLSCNDQKNVIFDGCDGSMCGREFWKCTDNGKKISVLYKAGECAQKNGPNLACKQNSLSETVVSSCGQSEDPVSHVKTDIPCYKIGFFDEASLASTKQDAATAFKNYQIYSDVLDKINQEIEDAEVRNATAIAQAKNEAGKGNAEACMNQ